MQHTRVVDQSAQRAEPRNRRRDRGGPLVGIGHIQRYRDDGVVAKCVYRRLDVVDHQIARGDAESVLVQPPHDRGTLTTRGPCDERDPIRRHRADRPVASQRWSAAPRRSA